MRNSCCYRFSCESRYGRRKLTPQSQDQEDAKANNAHDEQIQLGCAFHRIESRGSVRVNLQHCEFERSEVEPTPAKGLTSEKRNYNFHQTHGFLSWALPGPKVEKNSSGLRMRGRHRSRR